MYSIYLNGPRDEGVLIYDDLIPDVSYKLISPKLAKELDAAGTLSFEMPMSNVGYGDLNEYTSDVYVYRDGYENDYGEEGTDDIYWAGRVASVERGIENRKVVTCEGVLSFLNDSVQPPSKFEYDGTNLDDYLEYLLTVHDLSVTSNRQIFPGIVTASADEQIIYTNYESTMDAVQDILEKTEGHVRIRRSAYEGAPIWVLDILSDEECPEGTSDENKRNYLWVRNEHQRIAFGENMLSYKVSENIENLVTAVYPTGKSLEKENDDDEESYFELDGTETVPEWAALTEDSMGHWFILSALAASVGIFAKRIQDNELGENEGDGQKLADLGAKELTPPDGIQYEVEASAVDRSLLDRSLRPIDLHDILEVEYYPNGTSSLMRVSATDIPLNDPSGATYTIGAKLKRTISESQAAEAKKTAKIQSTANSAMARAKAAATPAQVAEMISENAETGETSGWKWRKWQNGDLDLWAGRVSTTLGAWGSYTTGWEVATMTISLPSQLLIDDGYTANVNVSRGVNGQTATLGAERISSTSRIECIVIKPSEKNITTLSADVSIHGRWK